MQSRFPYGCSGASHLGSWDRIDEPVATCNTSVALQLVLQIFFMSSSGKINISKAQSQLKADS